MGIDFAVGTYSAGGGSGLRTLLGGSCSVRESRFVRTRSGARKRWGTRWEHVGTEGSSSGVGSSSVPGLAPVPGNGLSGC